METNAKIIISQLSNKIIILLLYKVICLCSHIQRVYIIEDSSED